MSAEYSLVYPFVVVESHGGPFRDEDFVSRPHDSFVYVGRDRENYDGLRAALGISFDTEYQEFEVRIPHGVDGGIPTITVTFLPSAEQLANVLHVMTSERNHVRRGR